MQEPNNDRLEQFFQKAASRADVTFNEDDWKKLEARLDAIEAGRVGNRNMGKIAGAIVIVLTLLTSGVLWMHERYGLFTAGGVEETSANDTKRPAVPGSPDANREITSDIGTKIEGKGQEMTDDAAVEAESESKNESPTIGFDNSDGSSRSTIAPDDSKREKNVIADNPETSKRQLPARLAYEKIDRELVRMSPAIAQRNKQKAVIELPGAEEGRTREVEAMVDEEHASNQVKHVATPRLSLLLSFAPDFSGTSLGL